PAAPDSRSSNTVYRVEFPIPSSKPVIAFSSVSKFGYGTLYIKGMTIPSDILFTLMIQRIRFYNLSFLYTYRNDNDGESSYQNLELAGGNVHLITTKQSWDDKLSQASREGKIVSFLFYCLVGVEQYYLASTIIC
ncbi:hypothetical protein V2J09_000575, partial [Rumex salicifolius]